MENIEENKNNSAREIRDWILSIFIAVVVALFVRYFIVELYIVEGPSMMPTLLHGERIVVNKFIYKFRKPERGEILVFRYSRNPKRDYIKRVIALPGDKVGIKDGQVFVNNIRLNEDYILETTKGSYADSVVPEGRYYVMGDNRNNSEDSRFGEVGFVPAEFIKGKAIVVFWPLNQAHALP